MKEKGMPMPVAVAIAVVLVIISLGVGAVRGWSSNRNAALNHADIAAAADVLAMDAENMKTVAIRHLNADDPLIQSLDAGIAVLKDGNASAEELIGAAEEIRGLAVQLNEKVMNTSTVQSKPRDSEYMRTLTEALTDGNDVKAVYNSIASAFNGRMEKNLMGKLAMLLGIQPLPIY